MLKVTILFDCRIPKSHSFNYNRAKALKVYIPAHGIFTSDTVASPLIE